MPHEELPLHIAGRQISEGEWEGLPDLTDLLAHGGVPGVRYCLAPADRMGEMRRPPEAGATEDDIWWLVEGIKPLPFIVHGPKGSCDSVVLMGQGKPIPGASPANGRRQYYCHRQLLVQLGYEEAPVQEARVSREELRQETERNKAKTVGAARQAVESTKPLSPGGILDTIRTATTGTGTTGG